MAGFGTFAHYAGKCLDKWKGIAGLAGCSYAGYHIMSGNGLAGAGIQAAFGDDVKKATEQRGLWGGILKLGTGNEEADKDAVDAGVQLAQGMGRKVQDQVGNFAQQFGGGQSEYPQASPTVDQYSIDQQQAAALYQAMYGQQQGGLSQVVGGLAGNKTSMWGIAQIAAAAWMMFGNFGWMGKIIGAVLGNYGVKNLGIIGGQPRQMSFVPGQLQTPVQTPQQYYEQLMEQQSGRQPSSGIVMRPT